MEYPVFNPAVVPVTIDRDTVHIRAGPWAEPVFTISDEDGDGQVADLVSLLDGHTPVEEILDAFEPADRPEVASVVEQLHEKNIVYDRPEDKAEELWPHLALDRRFDSETEDHLPLDQQRVAVVNESCAGLDLVADLLEFGVGGLEYLRPVSPSDDDPRLMDDRITVIDGSAMRGAVERADFVVYLADRAYPGRLHELNEIAYETTTPWIPTQILGFNGIVGPAIFPEETACYECFEQRLLSNVPRFDGMKTYADALDRNEDWQPYVLRPFVRTVVGYMTLDLIHLLTARVGYTAGRAFVLNSKDMSIDSNDVLALPHCSVCGRDPTETFQRFTTPGDLIELRDGRRE
jgi:bacteriocin biosynthesis cyclodehydratase domain-containing protein